MFCTLISTFLYKLLFSFKYSRNIETNSGLTVHPQNIYGNTWPLSVYIQVYA